MHSTRRCQPKQIFNQDLDCIKNSWELKVAAASLMRQPLFFALTRRFSAVVEKNAAGSIALRRRRREIEDAHGALDDKKMKDQGTDVEENLSITREEASDFINAATRNSIILDNTTLNPIRTEDGYVVDAIVRMHLKLVLNAGKHTEVFRTTRPQYNYVIAQLNDYIDELSATSPAAEQLESVRNKVELRLAIAELESRGHTDLSQELAACVLAEGDPIISQTSTPHTVGIENIAKSSVATALALQPYALPVSCSVPMVELFSGAINDGWRVGYRLPESRVATFLNAVKSITAEESNGLISFMQMAVDRENTKVAYITPDDSPYQMAERTSRSLLDMLRSEVSRTTLVRVILPEIGRMSRKVFAVIRAWIPAALLGKKSEKRLVHDLKKKLEKLPEEDLVDLKNYLRKIEHLRSASVWDEASTIYTMSESVLLSTFAGLSSAGMLPTLRYAGNKSLVFNDKQRTIYLELQKDHIVASLDNNGQDLEKEFDNLQELLFWTRSTI